MIAAWIRRRRRRQSLVNWGLLCAPTVLLIGAVVASVWLRVPTRISVDLTTRRLTFDTGDVARLELLGETRGFSRLVIEQCDEASFEAATFAPVTLAAAGAPSNRAYSGPVRIDCNDPDARITLEAGSPEAAAGALDRIRLVTGERVAIHVAGERTPVITIDVSSPKRLDLPVYGRVLVTTELVETDPSFAARGDLAIYRTDLHPANSWFHLRTGRRTILVITPTKQSAGIFFSERLRIPVKTLQFVEETAAGLAPSFIADGVLTYPDYQSVAAVTIRGDEFFVLRRANDMEIRRLALLPERAGLALTVDGRVTAATIGRPDAAVTAEEDNGRGVDPRLTLYQVVSHGPMWRIVAAAALWGLATTWTWYERWKKLAD